MLRRLGSRARLERTIAAVWAEELGVERVSRDDDFLALGGTSLHAMWIVARVEGLTGLQLSVQTLLDTLTVAGMAAAIAETSQQARAVS